MDSKLKTLKDIEYIVCNDSRCIGDDHCESISRYNLKQEAINNLRSIKWIRKEIKDHILFKMWLDFFNITEEDLK